MSVQSFSHPRKFFSLCSFKIRAVTSNNIKCSIFKAICFWISMLCRGVRTQMCWPSRTLVPLVLWLYRPWFVRSGSSCGHSMGAAVLSIVKSPVTALYVSLARTGSSPQLWVNHWWKDLGLSWLLHTSYDRLPGPVHLATWIKLEFCSPRRSRVWPLN